MAAVAAGYRKSLVSARWPVLLLSCANGRRKCMVLSPCRGSISGFLGSFQSGGAFFGLRALTIERLVMSGCGQRHEPTKNF